MNFILDLMRMIIRNMMEIIKFGMSFLSGMGLKFPPNFHQINLLSLAAAKPLKEHFNYRSCWKLKALP
jgi:hypothetical protein